MENRMDAAKLNPHDETPDEDRRDESGKPGTDLPDTTDAEGRPVDNPSG